MCATCPFRDGSPYAYLRAQLQTSALTEASRFCHSTGTNAINGRTGKSTLLCRGARDLQLRYMHALGFISEPSDAAWDEKCSQLGLPTPKKK